ncbi:MAG: type I-E CRISPR-associated endoribonuclease Cas2e [Pyrinomonadaceae bacterium]|nr:type I-E CRISPR-associated endoribonuclease Cas2e [Pyrinomonadaceae bacterium]
MVVFLMEKVPISLRGEITRWMLELRPGVFVGNISALVREKLWETICQRLKGGAAMLLHSAANEQGYKIRTFGDSTRKVKDFDGLQLITISEKAGK